MIYIYMIECMGQPKTYVFMLIVLIIYLPSYEGHQFLFSAT